MRRRPIALLVTFGALGALVLSAQAAAPKPNIAPTVAFYGAPAVAQSEQPTNRAIKYKGAPLKFALTKVPRDMAEPTLGVTKSGSVYTVAAAFDSRVGQARTIMFLSRDGGRSFKPLQAGLGKTEANEASFDPYVYVDPDFGRAFNVDLLLGGTAITYTDDNGESWGNGFANVAGANDHQTLTAGVPPKGNPTLIPSDPRFPKIVYYCVNTIARIACAHSVDGGRTYVEAGTSPSQAVSTSGGIICGSLHGHAITDKDGRLFIPRTECGRLVLGVSEDGGLTWQTRTVAQSMPGSDPDSSVAADRDGNLYYTWYDAKHKLPYLTISRDHGVTWNTPRMIAPPGVPATWFPVVDVGDPGKVAIWFMGSAVADEKDKTRGWNNYAVLSTNALSANPTFVSTYTNKPGDPVHRGDCDGRCGNVLDFLDVVVAPNDSGRVWATSVDTCTGNCADDSDSRGQSSSGKGSANSRDGYIVRQISGPALRGKIAITSDTHR